jgi:hypothetical protein
MKHPVALVVGALALIAFASAAHAQSIAGTVRDESGAVLPGVTVEAASPALIEKTRTAVTDSSGQYRIVSLSPGLYTVTFSLPGFSTNDFVNSVNTTFSTTASNAFMRPTRGAAGSVVQGGCAVGFLVTPGAPERGAL